MAATNASDVYFGTYARFDTENKKVGAVLAGPDNAVGDMGDIVFELDEKKKQQAWLKNAYGKKIGFLDSSMSYKLAVFQAKGWTLRYVLSFAAYSEQPEPGAYWGQVAVIAYAPRVAEQFDEFVKVFAIQAGEGLRPDPDLGRTGVEKVLSSPKSWTSPNKVKISTTGKTAILKDHRSMHDKLLDQGRKKNIGCYIISWAFIAVLVVLAAWLLHSFGVF